MRNAAPILDSEALVTSTRTHKFKIFEALPPQFLFRQQWRLSVPRYSAVAAQVSGSSRQKRLQLAVSKGGSTRFLVLQTVGCLHAFRLFKAQMSALFCFSKALAMRRLFPYAPLRVTRLVDRSIPLPP
ncbi:hypothetical protein AVEN_198976-1 [Araneus ventricosus]|uniref:Uncharacterized protein n=1 Tax=Araneus ventricosus TaxID=182803 RepID=A0A4Y2EFB9_ARAVE|nr:hypothetical protein AVEN_40211-1 [Araneus ventricosus]GBM27023.1 hypothetical protein AVEN_139633-1 [Araneus ventricosus]GBM27058.1 hypothetical protein AVEN_171236-1 [Araneus ventricosus]GBM27062.1 hypothetical protein AVEN_198976-1 [Araneus ventricosus]